MTQEEQMKLFLEDQERRQEILRKKASDYATNDDILSNFKLTAAVARITPKQFAMNMLSLKVVRLGNLIGDNKDPMNESIIDSIEDLENYAFLLKCILKENEKVL